MTPHFFVAPPDVADDQVLLAEDDTRHLVTVLRARPGYAVSVSDGVGTVWTGSYQGDEAGRARVALLEATVVPRRRPSFTVVHALPKQRKLDEVVQRLTEIGVDRIVPVASQRSQVELDDRRATKAVTRWRAIALAAAKQSRRATVPDVADVGTWGTAFPAGSAGVVLWEESDVALRDALEHVSTEDDLLVGVGPEGGLTADEVAATGLPHASLGPAVLRTETAALVGVAALRYHYGLMEPA